MANRKLTADDEALILRVHNQRRSLPSAKQLARQLKVSPKAVEAVIYRARKRSKAAETA